MRYRGGGWNKTFVGHLKFLRGELYYGSLILLLLYILRRFWHT